ncbi:MAG: hypothetical protein ACK4UN_05985, partial [Limisphaerales bacterium]
MAKITGQTGMIEQPPSPGWDPINGDFIQRTWEGPKEYVSSLIAQLRKAKMAYQISYQGGKAVITARSTTPEDGQPEQPLDTWEAHVNVLEKDIFEHHRFFAASEGDRQKLFKWRRGEIQLGEEQDLAVTSPAGIDIYLLLKNEVTS